jgi:hypothetical protein
VWNQPSPSKLRKLCAFVAALVADWWRVDRIRASPREGQLLRLRAPCLLRVGTQLVKIERRSVGQSGDGPYIVYDCSAEYGPCQLWVTPIGRTHRPTLRWVQGGQASELSEEQVEVFQVR